MSPLLWREAPLAPIRNWLPPKAQRRALTASVQWAPEALYLRSSAKSAVNPKKSFCVFCAFCGFLLAFLCVLCEIPFLILNFFQPLSLSHTQVAPQLPERSSARLNRSTIGVLVSRWCTVSRKVPRPFPWTTRTLYIPFSRHNSRYSGTRSLTSRGLNWCRSNSPSMGYSTGSIYDGYSIGGGEFPGRLFFGGQQAEGRDRDQ